VQVLNIGNTQCKIGTKNCICSPFQIVRPSPRNIAWQTHCGTYLAEFIKLTKTKRSCIMNGMRIRNLLDTLEDLSTEVPIGGIFVDASSELEALLAS